jgi:predicted alternative tryptophan synthase beta-subunit
VKMATKKLPARWQGAKCVRGEGMKSETFDEILDRHVLDALDASIPNYIVIPDDVSDVYASVSIYVFRNKEIAVRAAKALSCGNVNHRVLTVTSQVLVVATDNEL